MPRRERPLSEAILADPRIGLRERLDAAERLKTAAHCCQGRFWRKALDVMLIREPKQSSDLLLPRSQYIIQSWVRVLDRHVSIADKERMNRRSETLVTQSGCQFQNFAAVSLLREVKAWSSASCARAAEMGRQVALDTVVCPTKPPKPKRPQSILNRASPSDRKAVVGLPKP